VFYTYILFSESLQKYYIGSSGNLEKRLEHHNLGLNRWSKRGIPWKIAYFETFESKTEAIKRELFLKKQKGKLANSVPALRDLRNTKKSGLSRKAGFDS
jgi:putative endonuclease